MGTETEQKDQPSTTNEANANGAQPEEKAAHGALGTDEIRRLKRGFEDYIDEVRRGNSHYGQKEFINERKAWFTRNVPGDAGLKPGDFEFPFDHTNPPKVQDGHSAEDE